MRVVFLTFFFSLNLFSQELPEWQSIPIREDLYLYRNNEIWQGLDFNELNKNLVESIKEYEPSINERRISGVTNEQGAEFLKQLKSENFYINAETQYDVNKNLGLCFGRAIYLHLLMLKYGVNKDSIKKIFAIGPMTSGVKELTWQFHVATMVKDLNSNDWWVLDTNYDEPLRIGEWVYQMKRRSQDKIFRLFRKTLIDKSKTIRFYLSKAQKIGPSGWEYNIRPGGLFDPFYNNYFRDVFKAIKNKVIPKEKKLNYYLAYQCVNLFK